MDHTGSYMEVYEDALSDACVEVKLLQWDTHPDEEEYYAGGQDNLACMNEYNIFPHPCANDLFVLDVMGNRCDQDFETVEAAKSAAQADYEQRIRSALTVTPKPEQCFSVKEGFNVHAYRTAGEIEPAFIPHADLSEALTTRSVEDVRREAFEEADRFVEQRRLSGLPIGGVIRALIDTPAPSRETQSSPEPVEDELETLRGMRDEDGYLGTAVQWVKSLIEDRNTTPQPDELRQAAALAWFEGRSSKRWDENPYAAPDEGEAKQC